MNMDPHDTVTDSQWWEPRDTNAFEADKEPPLLWVVAISAIIGGSACYMLYVAIKYAIAN